MRLMDLVKIGVIVTGLLSGAFVALLSSGDILAPLTAGLYSLQFSVRGPQAGSSDLLLIMIDEQSVKELGKFPWPRSRYAEMVDRLRGMGAQAIAFDFAFSDATPDDEQFAAACHRASNVYLPVRINYTEMGTEYREPPTAIANAVAGLGHVFVSPSTGQIVRSLALEHGSVQSGYFALSLLLSMAGLGIDESEVLPARDAYYNIGPLQIPVTARHEMLINYVGSTASFEQCSYADVLTGRLPEESVRGKLVLIGVTIPRYAAEYKTPIRTRGGAMADIVIQANVVDTLLRQRFIVALSVPYWVYPIVFALWAWFIGSIAGRWRVVASMATAGVALGLSPIFFIRYRVFFDLSGLVIGLLFSYLGITYLEVLRNIRRLRRLQAYAPPHLAMEGEARGPRPEGERKRVAVLFADVKSFTALAERKDPSMIYRVMKDCIQILVDETYRAEGTVDKFTGDGVMALFGVPEERLGDAERAVRAALNMQKALASFSREREKELGAPLQVRIGVNIGPVVVGDIGSDARMNFTAMGDTVNVAARLEQAARPGTVVVSEEIYHATAHLFVFTPLGPMYLRNRIRPVIAYQVIEERSKPHWEKRTLFQRRSKRNLPPKSP